MTPLYPGLRDRTGVINEGVINDAPTGVMRLKENWNNAIIAEAAGTAK